jgi:hypothetical protein
LVDGGRRQAPQLEDSERDEEGPTNRRGRHAGRSSPRRGVAVASSWNPAWREGPRWPVTTGRCLPVTEECVGCSGGDFLAQERGSHQAPSVSMAPQTVPHGERNGWGPGARSRKGEEREGVGSRPEVVGPSISNRPWFKLI